LTKDQWELQARARNLAEGQIAPRAAEVDRSENYPWKNCHDLREAGFFGLTVPKEFGGLGLGYLEAVLVIEEMAKVCGVTGRIVVEANMGAVGAVTSWPMGARRRNAWSRTSCWPATSRPSASPSRGPAVPPRR
jgi:alkylation response protein AidB-like acyl-CoA dehydrogenase